SGCSTMSMRSTSVRPMSGVPRRRPPRQDLRAGMRPSWKHSSKKHWPADGRRGRDIMTTEIRVPTLGESVTEATVGQWFKKAGDAVSADEPVVELETDKVTIEVPAPAAGVLSDIAVGEGDTVKAGA